MPVHRQILLGVFPRPGSAPLPGPGRTTDALARALRAVAQGDLRLAAEASGTIDDPVALGR